MYLKKSASSAHLVLIAALACTLAVSGCKSAPAPDDNAVNTALQAKFAGDTAIATEPIQTYVQNGVANLQGAVSSEAAKALAASDASQVSGVKSVVNQLTVQTAQTAIQPAPPPPTTTPATAAPTKPGKPSAMIQRPTPRPTRQQALNEPPPPPPPHQEQPAPIERRTPQPPPQPAPQAPPPPPLRNVTRPPGPTLPVRITQTLDSATTQAGDAFSGTIATDVMIDGLVAIRAGTPVNGRVDEVHEAGHFKGNSLLTISLVTLNRRGEHIAISTEPYSQQGKGRGTNTAAKVGGGAAVGAILGGIFGGGKGAAIGAAAGGGLGAGAQSVTRGQQVQIVSETLIRFRLTTPVELRTSTAPTSGGNANLQPRNSN
jgi:hypothetical protein